MKGQPMTAKRTLVKMGSRGFTLIELLIVVAILVALAGLILPNLDSVKAKANQGVTAATIADVSNTIQQHYAQFNVLPDRWDSLMSGGTLWTSLDPALLGVGGAPATLTTMAINDKHLYGLTRIGVTTVMDPNTSVMGVIPGNRCTIARTLKSGDFVASINGADSAGKAIINHFYPQQADPANPVPPGMKKLMVVGLGPQSSLIGKGLQEAPVFCNNDGTKYYNRYLAVFELCGGGCQARLMGVLGGCGDRLDKNITDYHTLPGQMSN
jgi:prepilin-type N-terminal cleavage/methylation domain-containing protein